MSISYLSDHPKGRNALCTCNSTASTHRVKILRKVGFHVHCTRQGRREKATTSVTLLRRISSGFASTPVKTKSPTCRDHVEKQTQKSPEPRLGKCVAVTQRPDAMSGVGMPPLAHCRTGCERHGGIHDEQGFETRCQDDKTVTSMLLGGPKELARSQLQKDYLHKTQVTLILREVPELQCSTQETEKLAQKRAPPDVGTADIEATSHHHR